MSQYAQILHSPVPMRPTHTKSQKNLVEFKHTFVNFEDSHIDTIVDANLVK